MNDEGDSMSDVQRPAVVLLSGGLDSATVLAIAGSEGFACHALSFQYGQRHAVELAAAVALQLAGSSARRRAFATVRPHW